MAPRYRFDDVDIDVQGFRLLKAGKAVAVEPKALNVLVFLVGNPGRLVERRELIQAVWGDAFVTDHVLNRAIGQLRKVLADDSKVPRYIETVPTLGYRFIARVETEASEKPKAPERQEPGKDPSAPPSRVFRWMAIGVGLTLLTAAASLVALRIRSRSESAAPAEPIRSLAVLPLENLSGDPSQDYVADGMTSELITDLAQIKALRVISQTTAMQYKNAHKPLPEIAKELQVDAVIEGTVMRANDQVQITARLVDAPRDEQLWAGSYSGNLGDILGLENQVAATVAERMRIQLSPHERTQLAQGRPVDPRAQDAYFEGNAASQPNTPDSWKKALPFFEQAAQLDPHFARAYVAIGRSYNFLGDSTYLSDPGVVEAGEAISGADSAIAKALELDPELGEAYGERAWTALKFRWDFQSGEAGFRRALELEPGAPDAHDGLAYALVAQGRFDEGLREIGLAEELDPLSLVVNTNYCRWLHMARQDERALIQCEATLRLAPDYHFALSISAELYERSGNYAEGHKLLAKLGCDTSCLAMRDEIHGAPRVSGAFDAWLKKQKQPPEAFFMARAYAGLHRKEEAFAWLEKAYELHSDVAVMSLLSVDPDFDSLRSDPRFDAFLRHVGLPPQPRGLF